MQDAWRAYLEMALGVTEASKKKAEQIARNLMGRGNTTAAQLQALAEELLTVGTANRESLTKLVRFEVDRALGAVGLATADEVAELTGRLRQLEAELRDARTRAAAAEAAAGTATQAAARAASDGGARAAADAIVAGTTATEPVSGAPTPASDVPAKKAVAKKAVAKKTIAKKAVAVKAVAKKTPAAVQKTTPEPAKTARKAAGTNAEPAAKKAAPRKRPAGGGAA
ncbi:Polyhydroxyalkanoate synthesis regulator phasin [Micromonospora pattaloongensis]|uniref:Polyhydroxyalkanoate synthesis regulator phasin n=1 Tax=Micromonospora pattaloongensis TaxID=405436 RepID=A0A1H3T3N1_9ACTN|nr:hypothetical protein [Micromonospora pattaloongensis]SDZ43969.1 Polyhydroxyalkanoate synthesis regulator phasin [Micromonospora pattaloongensis]